MSTDLDVESSNRGGASYIELSKENRQIFHFFAIAALSLGIEPEDQAAMKANADGIYERALGMMNAIATQFSMEISAKEQLTNVRSFDA
jgi:hypothetical protein